MKKIVPQLLIIIIPLIFSSLCKGNIGVQPPEISITMKDEFIHGNTSKKITITNTNNNDINATWYLEHPDPPSSIRPNRTFIPDLSWIDVKPKNSLIPPNGAGEFFIYLNIPENIETLDKHWETWITFKQESSGGIFNQEYAVRVYMDTPTEIAFNNQSQGLPMSLIMTISIAIFVIIGIGTCFVIVRILRTKKQHIYSKKKK